MKLTNREAIKALKKARCLQLEEMIEEYPQKEVGRRSDWDMIANEAGWLLSMYHEDETAYSDDLRDAQHLLSRIRYAPNEGKDEWGRPYKDYEIQQARDMVNEYRRLSRFVTQLQKRGLYCPYC